MSTSSSDPGRAPNRTSTISSKLNSQNGRRRLRGLSTKALSPNGRPYSLCASSTKILRSGRARRISCSIRTSRLADAGGAEHGEVLAQHVVDVDVSADRAVLLQVPDLDH